MNVRRTRKTAVMATSPDGIHFRLGCAIVVWETQCHNRMILLLRKRLEMTMKEIGLTLDLSESRVSQMHSSILARLKAQMQHREKEF